HPEMKPAAFAYSRPASVEEACALLAADDGARLIAGGQTLVPLMAMRLARPTRLVDIARGPGPAHVREEAGAIAIGAAPTASTIRWCARSCRCWRARSPSSGMAPRGRAAPLAARSPTAIRRPRSIWWQ